MEFICLNCTVQWNFTKACSPMAGSPINIYSIYCHKPQKNLHTAYLSMSPRTGLQSLSLCGSLALYLLHMLTWSHFSGFVNHKLLYLHRGMTKKSNLTKLITKLLLSLRKITSCRMRIHKVILCLTSVVEGETELSQNSYRKTLPQPGGQWHWCSWHSSRRAPLMCLWVSFSRLLPPLSLAWALFFANHRINHKSSWDIHEVSPFGLEQRKENKPSPNIDWTSVQYCRDVCKQWAQFLWEPEEYWENIYKFDYVKVEKYPPK